MTTDASRSALPILHVISMLTDLAPVAARMSDREADFVIGLVLSLKSGKVLHLTDPQAQFLVAVTTKYLVLPHYPAVLITAQKARYTSATDEASK